MEGNDDDKVPIKFDIVSQPTVGTLDNFDPSTGTLTYVPEENNEIEVLWHNYIKDMIKLWQLKVSRGSDKFSSAK